MISIFRSKYVHKFEQQFHLVFSKYLFRAWYDIFCWILLFCVWCDFWFVSLLFLRYIYLSLFRFYLYFSLLLQSSKQMVFTLAYSVFSCALFINHHRSWKNKKQLMEPWNECGKAINVVSLNEKRKIRLNSYVRWMKSFIKML